MKEKLIALIIILAATFIATETAYAIETQLQYFPDYNSIAEEIYMNTEIPVSHKDFNYYERKAANGTVIMLPIRSVLNDYAETAWDEDSRTVSVKCGTMYVELEIGSRDFIINGERGMLDVEPEIHDGKTYVPASFFSKAFGFWFTDSGEGVIDLFMPSYIIENI